MTEPQAPDYLKWVKYNLVQGNGIQAFVMCKGDAHTGYGIGPYDHIEPIWGIYSNNLLNESTPLEETVLYEDDWIVHGSDYGPDGKQNLGYFRNINDFNDTTAMNGSCKNA